MKTISPSHKSWSPRTEGLGDMDVRAGWGVETPDPTKSLVWLTAQGTTRTELHLAAQTVAKSGPDMAQLWQFLMHNAASIELLMQ